MKAHLKDIADKGHKHHQAKEVTKQLPAVNCQVRKESSSAFLVEYLVSGLVDLLPHNGYETAPQIVAIHKNHGQGCQEQQTAAQLTAKRDLALFARFFTPALGWGLIP